MNFANSPGSAINVRSVGLGTALTVLVAALVPYNDFVVGNGFLICCYLPVVFVFCMFGLTVFINAPLRRFLPRYALTGNELAVISLMMLAACSIPCQGLLRSFLPALVHPFYHGQYDDQFWKAFTAMGLPRWLFPVGDITNGRASPVMHWFYARVPDGQAVPYAAWFRPLLGWGVFLCCMFTSLVCAAVLLYPQWAVNERLAFPIAQVELALISSPERGRMFNAMYRSKLFWIGTAIAFFLQSQSALHIYFPRRMPELPLYYDFTKLMSFEPFIYLSGAIKKNSIVFLFLSMGYLIQARVGFSIWASFILLQVVVVTQQMLLHVDMPGDAMLDQHLGASLVLLFGIFWVGRPYWRRVLADKHAAVRLPLVLLIFGFIGMGLWLCVVGVSIPMALLVVLFLLMAHVVAARIVAETGLPIFRSYAAPGQLYMRLSTSLFNGRDVYFAQFLTVIGAYTSRESITTFFQHGLWLFDRSHSDTSNEKSDHTRTQARPRLGLLVAWTIIVSFTVGTASSLHCYYHYALPLTRLLPQTIINPYGAETLPTNTIAVRLVQHAHGNFAPSSWNPAVHIGAGAAIAAVLLVLSLRMPSWPLVPAGYILATTPFIGWVWYSAMLGWLIKVLVLRFGGPRMFQQAKPLFIGLIVGEAFAAAMWLLINLVLANFHYDYHPILFYPS